MTTCTKGCAYQTTRQKKRNKKLSSRIKPDHFRICENKAVGRAEEFCLLRPALNLKRVFKGVELEKISVSDEMLGSMFHISQ